MSDWFYTLGGQQCGPISFEQLQDLARSGGLDPAKDLVWTGTMKDWTPAWQVAGLFAAATAAAGPPAAPANPYAPPQSSGAEAAGSGTEALPEIVPGSEPINVGACVKRGFEMTTRNFGIIVLVGLTYLGVMVGVGVILGLIDAALGFGHATQAHWQSDAGASMTAYHQNGSPLSAIVSQVLSLFLSLGTVRIGLNLASGREVNVGQLFGEGGKLLRTIGATILFTLMVSIGLLFLIVPGVYLALRFGQYMMAIVDRDLGIMDAFAYSSALTANNRLNLFLLGLLSMLVVLAGLLALGVGLIFAAPVVWLSSMVAYRWMQYGHRAVMDQPGTKTPLLASV